MSTSRIVMAMSGGVDSSVAAARLVEQGHDVVGLFMRSGVAPGPAAARGRQGCCSVDDAMDARAVAAKLDIPFFAVNFEDAFERIIDYFVDEYRAGRTPNPCVQCNRWLKFGELLRYADEIGAEYVATGHYARIVEEGGRLTVARPADAGKDQTYVLFPLSQDQLSRTLLPIGDLTKAEVRAEADRLGLGVADKPDSQEICFVPDNDYGGLLRRRLPEGTIRPGPILDTAGQEIGTHEGYPLYTVGQRKGLGGGFGRRLYVVEIRPDENAIVVGERSDLAHGTILVDDVIWSGHRGLGVGEILSGRAKARYLQDTVPATALALPEGKIEIRLEKPLDAVTPGQGAVFYDEDDRRVLFGGFVERATSRPMEV